MIKIFEVNNWDLIVIVKKDSNYGYYLSFTVHFIGYEKSTMLPALKDRNKLKNLQS
ncbi:hypothetical protein SIO70_19075 [Chitinophaga sancti]|uniref:hypothetical protein n=1 Tax=Chitinophaga sancti TaxID=1004 RepID=UPI002A7521F3|nr:hypothetical protein [Chitinophaga sancti]WPQ60453.1 hypothetical protein SIO70_19075 [Chitinophaga sancti]